MRTNATNVLNSLRRFLRSLFGSKAESTPVEVRRSGADRRTGEDRRLREGEPLGTDRRSGTDRRKGQDRRSS